MVDSRKTYIPSDGGERKEGYAKLKVLRSIDKSLDRVVDHLVENAELQASGTPAYDTGFIFMDHDQTENVEHKLGQLPTRITLFYCTVQEPRADQDTIFVIPSARYSDTGSNVVGVEVGHLSENKLQLISGTYLHGTNTRGYVRLLIWR